MRRPTAKPGVGAEEGAALPRELFPGSQEQVAGPAVDVELAEHATLQHGAAADADAFGKQGIGAGSLHALRVAAAEECSSAIAEWRQKPAPPTASDGTRCK